LENHIFQDELIQIEARHAPVDDLTRATEMEASLQAKRYSPRPKGPGFAKKMKRGQQAGSFLCHEPPVAPG